MKLKATKELLDRAIELLDQGMTVEEISKIVNLSPRHLSKHLEWSGIAIPNRRRTRVVNVSMIIRAYETGASAYDVGKQFRISEMTVIRRLREAGIQMRPRSQNAGTKHTTEALLKMASRKSRIVGHGEQELFDALQKAGLPVEAQTVCGKYNIDLTVDGRIAIELTTSGKSVLEKYEDLTAAGYTVVHVRIHDMMTFRKHLDELVTTIETIHHTPIEKRKHWRIRCGKTGMLVT